MPGPGCCQACHRKAPACETSGLSRAASRTVCSIIEHVKAILVYDGDANCLTFVEGGSGLQALSA